MFTHSYDQNNNEVTITNPQSKTTTMVYDPLNRATLTTYGNGALTAKSYDAAGRLTSILNLDNTATTISYLTYQYDKVGNRTLQVEADGTITTWSYDEINQLTREQRSGDEGFDNQYQYDAAGNRTLLTDASSQVTTYAYSDANRLMTANQAGAVTTYSHDAAGNRTQVTDPQGVASYYQWDAVGRMTIAELPEGVVTMTYNADRQRVQKQSTDGSVTGFLYDHKTLLHETDGEGDPTNTYTNTTEEYGGLISEYEDSGTPVAFYHQFDAQHATNAITDDSGSVVQQMKYSAFGLPSANSVSAT